MLLIFVVHLRTYCINLTDQIGDGTRIEELLLEHMFLDVGVVVVAGRAREHPVAVLGASLGFGDVRGLLDGDIINLILYLMNTIYFGLSSLLIFYLEKYKYIELEYM